MTEEDVQARLDRVLSVAAAEQARGIQMGVGCAVHTHDEWVPLNDHHVWPLGMGGPDKPANKVTLCMNGHGAVHAYLDLLVTYGADFDDPSSRIGAIPWTAAMHYGPAVRELAYDGWVLAGRPIRR